MALYVGGTEIKRVLVNGTDVCEIYCNGTKVFENDIKFIGSAGISFVGTATKTISLSSIPLQAGDLIICSISNGYYSISPLPNTPNGFTSLFAASGGNSYTNPMLRVAYRVATGTETSVTIVPNISTSGGGAVVHVYRNVDTTNPFEATAYSSGNTYTNNVDPLPVTTSYSNTTIVVAGACYATNGENGYWSNTGLSEFIDEQNAYYDSTPETYGYLYGSAAGMGYLKVTPAGTYDPQSWTWNGNNSGANYLCLTMALKPNY